MINIQCHTNLDNTMCESWPDELSCRPIVGDSIESKTKWSGTHLTLEVVSTTWRYSEFKHEYILCVGLHIPKYSLMSISEWEEWYQKLKKRA